MFLTHKDRNCLSSHKLPTDRVSELIKPSKERENHSASI